jgi:hypothetical protein
MSCKSCSSGNLRNFPTEIAVHLKGIGRPHVFVFPEILVCLNCGFSELEVAEDKLKVLAEDPSVTASTRDMLLATDQAKRTPRPSA